MLCRQQEAVTALHARTSELIESIRDDEGLFLLHTFPHMSVSCRLTSWHLHHMFSLLRTAEIEAEIGTVAEPLYKQRDVLQEKAGAVEKEVSFHDSSNS